MNNEDRELDFYDKLWRDSEEHGRCWAVMHSSNTRAAYEELYGEHPWEFDEGEW